MKIIIYSLCYLLTIIVLFSCDNTARQQTKVIRDWQIELPRKPHLINLPEKKYNYSIDSSFIGKFSNELNLSNLHCCLGMSLQTSEGFAISIYTDTIKSCLNGDIKIVLEKFKYRKDDGSAVYEIIDEINVYNSRKTYHHCVSLKLENDSIMSYYLVKYEDDRKPYLKNIITIWAIDIFESKFIKLENIKLDSLPNPDYIECD